MSDNMNDNVAEWGMQQTFIKNINIKREIYCCPVCQGSGIVPNGFYTYFGQHYSSINVSPETCRSCTGKGYVFI